MMNGFNNIMPVQRISQMSRMNHMLSGQGADNMQEKGSSKKFSSFIDEARREWEDSLAQSMEDKVNYYGSDAQAVYYQMTMSRSFRA